MPRTTYYTKDPNAVLDYVIDWSDWLGASETISSSAFTVATGLTKDSESDTDTTAIVWLSGGTAGTDYLVTCRITTNQARTDDRSVTIRVRQR